jgi:hypothetical protein
MRSAPPVARLVDGGADNNPQSANNARCFLSVVLPFEQDQYFCTGFELLFGMTGLSPSGQMDTVLAVTA